MILPNLLITPQIKNQIPALQLQTWKNIPQVSVLTGLNGSGKTKLLGAITSYLLTQGKRADQHFFFIPCYHNPDSLLQASDSNKRTQEETRISRMFKSWKNNWKNNPQLRVRFQQNNQNNAEYQILEYLETLHKKKITEFSDIEINEIVTEIPFEQMQSNINNIKISEIFIRFLKIEEKVILKLFEDEAEADTTIAEGKTKVQDKLRTAGYNKAPWELINEKFKDNQFKHTISKPINSDNYSPKFVTEAGQEIDFTQLSSGEKVIVQLILWSYDSANNTKTNNHNKLFIMDEFDAHLNPFMAEMFIKIVKEVLVEQFKMQVILTTHSPSTIAYCDEESIFWMEKGKVLQGNEKKSKQDVIKNLATGLVLLEDNTDIVGNLFDALAGIEGQKHILFVEGETDKIYLEGAIKQLQYYNTLEKVSIIPCRGASKIPAFIQILNCIKNKNIIKVSLFDDDKAGRMAKSNIDSKEKIIMIQPIGCYNEICTQLRWNNQNKQDKEKVNFPVEFLFSKSLLEQMNILEENRDISVNEKHTLDGLENKYANDLWMFQKQILSDKTKCKKAKKSLAQYIENNLDKVDFTPLLELISESFSIDVKEESKVA